MKGSRGSMKQSRNPREVVPPTFTEIRKPNPVIKTEENFNAKRSKKVKEYLQVFEDFPEWPNQEEVDNFSKSQIGIKWEKFNDPEHHKIFLPFSLMEECAGNIFWRRPNEFIADYYITREIAMRYPLKNMTKFKKFIYEIYSHDTCPMETKKKRKGDNRKDTNLANYTSENKRIFKNFFKYFDKSDFSVIKLVERDDFVKNPEDDIGNIPIAKLMTFGGSKILLDEKTSFFNKWISSILQFLREFEVNDDDEEPIWKKIYPQQNGVPFYNHNGRYWIKLHHKGKPRKIEIDDLMPCNKDLDCLLPRCQTIEELWPLIISKAILKLFSYKFKLNNDPNCIIGDIQIIHAITGYYANIINMNENNSLLEGFVKKIELKPYEEINSNNEDIINKEKENDNNNNILDNNNIKENDKDKENEKSEKNFFLFFNNNGKEIKEENLNISSKNLLSIEVKNPQDESQKNKENNINNKDHDNKFLSHNENSAANFLSLKKKGSITNMILPKIPLEPVKLTQIINEKPTEILLKNSSVERSINNKVNAIKRLSYIQKQLLEENNNFKSPVKRMSNIGISHTTSLQDKKSKISSKELFKNSEEINKSLKRASLFPQQSINDLNKIFSTAGNAHLFDIISKDYEDMNQVIKKSRKSTFSNSRQIQAFSLNNQKNSVSISRENSSKKGKSFKNFRKENNSMYGMCYPVLEVFNTKGFNKIRFGSIDINELKDILTDIKFSYKKSSKEEKKDFMDKIIEIGNTYRDKKNKRIREMQEKSKSTFLFKICNNCHDSPPLKVYCDLNEDEIEIILECFLNSLDFPPFEFYKNLSDNVKNNPVIDNRKLVTIKEEEKDGQIVQNSPRQNSSNLNNSNLANKVLSPIRNSNLRSSPKKKTNISNLSLMDRSSLNNNNSNNPQNFSLNNNNNKEDKNKNLELSKKNSTKMASSNSIIEGKKSELGKSKTNLNLQKNKSFFSVFDEINKMTTDEYLFEIYKEMIDCDYEKYENMKKIKRKNVKGNWLNFEEMKKNFEHFVFLFKNEKLKIRSNINTNSFSQKDKFNKTDDQLKVYLITLSDHMEKNNNEEDQNAQMEIENEKKENKPKSKISKKSIKEKEVIESELLSPKNIDIKLPTPTQQSILIEFCSNSGKIGDLEEMNYFIVFDIYEINTNLNENNECEGNINDKNNKNNNNNFDNFNSKSNNRKNIKKNLTQSKNDSLFSNGKIRLVCEDIQLKGFYAIFYKDIFESEKNYLLFVKSSFAPFGYNLKIMTQLGTVESMSYDKYLLNYGGMKLIKNHLVSLPLLESNTKFLAAKFLLKFNSKDNNLNSMEAFKEILKKSFIELKINITSSDLYLPQFFTLYLSKLKSDECITSGSIAASSIVSPSSGFNISGNKSANFGDFNSNSSGKIEDKIFPINEIFYLNLNDYEINDQLIASVILNVPYDINPETQISIDFLAINSEHINVSNLEILEPYEISDSNKLGKKNLIFKEIFYVSEKVFSSFIINISRNSQSKADSSLIHNQLESLKEVSEDSFTNSSSSDLNNENEDGSVFIKSISKGEKEKIQNNINNSLKISNQKYLPKIKNKIYCLLKIYKNDILILSLEFYDSILIPNLVLKGIPVPNELLNPKEVKGKKEPSAEEINNFVAKMTQYKIQCFVEGNEVPSYLRNENLIDWKIQIFSTDTIGFVKDTTKEDSERALINSWEINQVGRSQKAENARFKFVEDRKFQVDSYIQENEKENFRRLERKKQILPSNFKVASNNNNLSMEDILNNISILKNPHQILHETSNLNLNITQDKINLNDSISLNININNSILNNNNNNRSYLNINNRSQSQINSNNYNLAQSIQNPLNQSQIQSNLNRQNNLTKVATSIIIDENLPILNEKLKKANDYYSSKNLNKNNNNNDQEKEINIDNVSEINIDNHNRSRSKSPIPNLINSSDNYSYRYKFPEIENNNNRSIHVSGFIKNFINQAHEEKYFEESEDIFKLKNCKINSKALNQSQANNPHYTFIKPEIKGKAQSLRGGNYRGTSLINNNNNFDPKNFQKTLGSNKLRTYNSNLAKKRNLFRNDNEKMQEVRNSFMSSFNENINKEENLYYDLVNNFEINLLDNYCKIYKELVNANLKQSSTLIDIKNMLSLRKDQLISNAFERNEIKNKSDAEIYFNDVKENNWKISNANLNSLLNLMNNFNY